MNKQFTIKILSVGTSSISGITYSKEILTDMINKFNDPNVLNIGWTKLSKDIPDSAMNLKDPTHVVESIYMKDEHVYADIRFLDTVEGNKLLNSNDIATLYPHPIMIGKLEGNKEAKDLVLESLNLLVFNPAI